MIIVVMGVCASGKTTIGQALAKELSCSFFDGDDYHSAVNREKMATGVALTDQDRQPWLQDLANLAKKEHENGKSAIIACSALKLTYREILRGKSSGLQMDIRFVYLKLSENQIRQRLIARKGHFFNAQLVTSQFEALEEPREGTEKDVITIDGSLPVEEIVKVVKARLPL